MFGNAAGLKKCLKSLPLENAVLEPPLLGLKGLWVIVSFQVTLPAAWEAEYSAERPGLDTLEARANEAVNSYDDQVAKVLRGSRYSDGRTAR